jgi:threonine/homoserine/homoserine lactone efflux protein
VAGNEIGVFCWALAAAARLTALLQANRLLFDALHIGGAIVLAWLGPYCAGIVLLADRIRPWLSRAEIRRRMERALGAVLVALGIELAVSAR